MHHATHLDPATMPPTQYAAVWDIRDSLRQTTATSLMIPPTDPGSPPASENGYSLISVQPVGICLAQLQVSPATAPNRVR